MLENYLRFFSLIPFVSKNDFTYKFPANRELPWTQRPLCALVCLSVSIGRDPHGTRGRLPLGLTAGQMAAFP